MSEPRLPVSRPERVTATVAVSFDVAVNGREAALSPETLTVDLTDLFRSKKDPLARHMMPMKIEQAAGDVSRRMLARLGVKP